MNVDLTFNSSLIKEWSSDLITEEPYNYPFRSDYQKLDKKLFFIATLHTTDLQSETFSLIKKTIDENSIDFIFVEGILNSNGISPNSVTEWAVKAINSKTNSVFETAYAISLAAQNNIPYAGLEPDEDFILKILENKGFLQEDYVYYVFLQQIFQLRESGADEIDLSTEFNKIKHRKYLKLNITLNSFFGWYNEINKRHFDYKLITDDELAPYGNGLLKTQIISSKICKARDSYSLNLLEEAFINNNSIVICLGGSHWSMLKIAIQNQFGEPTFLKEPNP